MTERRPAGRPHPFGPDELAGVPGIPPDELAAETRLARDLERLAATGGGMPSAGFGDRVMDAIAREPVPSPAAAARSALRRRAVIGFLASVRDSFRVAFGSGFPAAVRAQALAIVLLATGVVAGSGAVTAGALGLLADGAPPPSPSVPSTPPLPSVSPVPTDTPSATFVSPSPSPTPSTGPGETGEPSERPSPGETEEPDETEDPGGTGSGDGSGEDGGSDREGSARIPSPSPRETEDADETHTPKPDDTPDPDDTPSPAPTADGDDD